MTMEYGGNNPEFDTLSTKELINAADGQPWETLKDAGFETGDVLPVGTYTGVGSTSTTSDTFTTIFTPDSAVAENYGLPNSDQVRVNFTAILRSGSDTENVEARCILTSGNVMSTTISVTSTGKEFVSSGWHDPPNTPSTNERMVGELRSSGSNSGFIEEPVLQVGLQI